MENTDIHKCPAWPKILLATWTLLGVFKGRPIDVTRPCLLCHPDGRCGDVGVFDGDDDDEARCDKEMGENDNHRTADFEEGEGPYSQCVVCKGLMWNADGMVVSDSTNAVTSWFNNRPVGIMSFIFIVLFSAFCLWTIGWYFFEYWGKIESVTHFTSFVAYASVLLVVALICTVLNGMQYIRRAPGKRGCWYEVMDTDYIARRIRCLAGRRFQLPEPLFLILSMVWAIGNISLQIVNLVEFLNSSDFQSVNESSNIQLVIQNITVNNSSFLVIKTELGVVIALIGLPMYASFWYYVLVMRSGLAAELNLVIMFIKQNEGRLDWCRRRIVETHREIDLLRRVLSGLMPFVVTAGVLGITVHVTWNYNVYSEDKKNQARENFLINIMIFSEKFMVVVVPILAVGGLNIDHIWEQFTYALSRQRSHDYEEFWDRVLKFTAELDPERHVIDLTVFLSVISLYLSRNLKEQELN